MPLVVDLQESPKDRAARLRCYCGIWATHPRHYPSHGVPEGYCGLCQRCGRPGHTRHFPGGVPYTGCWCDRHFEMLKWLHPLGSVGWRIYLVLLAAAAIGTWALFT